MYIQESISVYAPVLITTLSRYEKLIQCIESLENCTGANHTEVYVAIDYPPSKKYEDGWKKITDYLDKKEKDNRFKILHVIHRKNNCGVGHSKSNYSLLLKEVENKYDRFIFSEEDNIFSPNFLEFMNKGLEKFKDDQRICYISGYNYQMTIPSYYNNNFYITQDGSPWGMGGWFNKLPDINRYKNLNVMRSLIRDKKKYAKLKKIRPQSIHGIINMLKRGHLFGDTCNGCYAAMEDKFWILPTISKVKNIGNDGSGLHSSIKNNRTNDFYNSQIIDNAENFEFTADIFTTKPHNLQFHTIPSNRLIGFIKRIILNIDIFLLRNFNFLPKTKYI